MQIFALEVISFYILSLIAVAIILLAVGYYLGVMGMLRLISYQIPDAAPFLIKWSEERKRKKRATKDFDSEVNR